MTENAEDCKQYYLSLTKNQYFKRYNEYKYDPKRTVNMYKFCVRLDLRILSCAVDSNIILTIPPYG